MAPKGEENQGSDHREHRRPGPLGTKAEKIAALVSIVPAAGGTRHPPMMSFLSSDGGVALASVAVFSRRVVSHRGNVRSIFRRRCCRKLRSHTSCKATARFWARARWKVICNHSALLACRCMRRIAPQPRPIPRHVAHSNSGGCIGTPPTFPEKVSR